MLLYPLLRKQKVTNEKIFVVAIGMAVAGYVVLLALCLTGFTHNLIVLACTGAVVFAANGVLYFVTSLFIPETKGKSLDELEHLFDKRAHRQ